MSFQPTKFLRVKAKCGYVPKVLFGRAFDHPPKTSIIILGSFKFNIKCCSEKSILELAIFSLSRTIHQPSPKTATKLPT